MAAFGKNFILATLWLCTMFATPSQQIECKGHDNYKIDPMARDLILELHNRKRMETARGQYKNGRNSFYISYGKNILEMKYDCDLETKAHEIASACPETETLQATLTDQGENFIKINKEYPEIGSPTQAVYIAGTTWFEEITKNGINQNLDFTQNFANKKPTVYHWSQMVWAKSWKIGCEIGACGKFTIVVCRYSPKGNVVGQKVYQPYQRLACENGESLGYSSLCAYPS
ncbi:unnamed protein product [Cylicocyclus nassatus]|uniref:SCP domain-containing protein n=1 Tax=Cylicocyclus nassatus TaxID=53992 RepID=A0AA36DU04_CYLNA|nr:unnamed protein product [Cylicocyclus nassatus]